MDTKNNNLNWILGPAVLTLAITLMRLWGELSGWDERWFGTGAGSPGALFGIWWLMPGLGIYFGYRLIRNGNVPVHRGKALLFSVLGLACFAGPMTLLVFSQEEGVRSMSFIYGFLGVGLAAAFGGWVAYKGWPALGKLMFVYGIAARLPVIVLTYILVPMDKGTHYEKLAPAAPTDLSWVVNATFLSYAQAFVWVPGTIFLGVLFGALISLFVRPVK